MTGPRPFEELTDVLDEHGFALVHLGPTFIVYQVALAQQGPALSLDQCDKGFQGLCTIMDGIRYWRGDLMNLTEGLFAEEAAQIIDHERLSEAEAKAEMFVASHVTASTRAQAPSWEHARVVAKLTPSDQETWLQQARSEQWTARKLSTEIGLASADGKTFMRWLVVVDAGTEAKRDKLADKLSVEGFTVSRKDALRKQPKPKRAKKQVTARARKAPKSNTRRRKN